MGIRLVTRTRHFLPSGFISAENSARVLNSRDPLLPIRIGEEQVDVSRRLPARERCRLDPTGPDGARLRDLIARSPPHGKNCRNRPDQPQLIIEQERLEIRAAMNIDSGTAIVLVYVLVSMGVIIASLLAALATGWFIDRLRERRSRQTVPGGENAERGRTDQVPPSLMSLSRCADHLQNAASPSRSMSGRFAALRWLDRPLLNVRNSFYALAPSLGT
jgi:hypothetical protein